MTPDEKFAAALSEITGKRIDPPPACICDPYGFQGNSNCPACNPEFSTSGFETREDSPDEIAREAREEKHQKDSIRALERLLFSHGDEAHTRGHRYDRARRALVEAIDDWNRLQPLLALPRLEDGPVNDIDTMLAPPSAQALTWEDLWRTSDQQATAALDAGDAASYNQYLDEVSEHRRYNQYLDEVSDFLGYGIKSGSTEDEIAYDQHDADVSAEETAEIIREILRDGAS